jgi:TolB protein
MKPWLASLPRKYLLLSGLILALTIAITMWLARPAGQTGASLPAQQTQVLQSPQTTETPPQTATRPLETPTETGIPVSLPNASPWEKLREEGVMILSMRDGHFAHLFAFHPVYLPLTRLTSNPWDDITPAISPDGSFLAYSSRRNGYWDLYVLNLATGAQTRLTDTAEYEASPSWSPDGQWLAFERFDGNNTDIFIVPLEGGQEIRLTDHNSIDRSPAWSPLGREIAFVSTRSGDEEIWVARLDDFENRFLNISRASDTRDRYPSWSADGRWLAFSSEKNGERRLSVWDAKQPEQPARHAGEGERTTWSPDGSLLFSQMRTPNENGLVAYPSIEGSRRLPYTALPGDIYGLSWVKGPLPFWLEDKLRTPGIAVSSVLSEPVLTLTTSPTGRSSMIQLEDVTAPVPMLHDAVDEAFNNLRGRVAEETGWDALSSLENAYVALTTPPIPSMQEDWLYTGRAFAVNPLLLSAEWMAITREDYGGQTYWRVFLKARYQDGSMGTPLPEMVWDLNARYASDTRAYEQGGQLKQSPAGYWIDLTEIASRYGWERLPSKVNWRTFYPSIRFNMFVITGGLDWYRAMAEVYPPEALVSVTPMPTRTPTQQGTQQNTRRMVTPTLTPTVTPTSIPTRRPTWTPLPYQTLP